MYAFLFTLCLFSYFIIVGVAFLAVFPPRLRLVQSFLISPTIGIALSILPVFFINRLGVPVKEFGAMLSSGLLAASFLAITVVRPVLPIRRLFPHFILVLGGLLLAARPMFSYGFDWISFANDDMANYCLGAQRFYENGFFAEPNMEAFFQGRDYSQAFWFMHVLNNTRSGSELLLATVWATTGYNPHMTFMPVIFALHGALIFASAALVSGPGLPKRAGVMTGVMVAISPMTTLGALYQLIAQVGGLAMLCVAALLVYRPIPSLNAGKLVRVSVAAILIGSCLVVYYPEVLPFLGAGWLVFILWSFGCGNIRTLKRILITSAVVAIGLLLLLNTYVYDAFLFLLSQASGGIKKANAVEILFPYFLIPSGLPVFWGIAPIASNILEPFASAAVLVGVLVFVLLVKIAFLQIRMPATAVTSIMIVMVGVGLFLFYRNNDFGLFKLAMFAQPFILGVLALGLFKMFHWKVARWKYGLISFFVLCNLLVQAAYVEKSTGEVLGSLGELPHASKKGIIREFSRNFLIHAPDSQSLAILTTSHIVVAKLQSLYTSGFRVLFSSRQFVADLIEREIAKNVSSDVSEQSINQSYKREKEKYLKKIFISTADGNNSFLQLIKLNSVRKEMDFIPGLLDVFNRYGMQTDVKDSFELQHDHRPLLYFIHSDFGQHYYLGEAGHIAFYALENDPMFAGREFAAFGRYFLFEVQAAENQPRLVMELTSTLVKQVGSALPDVKIQSNSIGFVGRGSGRLFSLPITPEEVNGTKYLSIDMGLDASPMNEAKSGLMLAYGRDVRLDRRLITTFGRDISLISSEDYENLTPPKSISNFPSDLANSNLEYSGIYEDGWVSERAFFVLISDKSAKFLRIKGSMPQINRPDYTSTIKLKINGNEVADQKVGLGNFELKIPVTDLNGRQRIDIAFTEFQQLPGEDGRITGGKIDFIGFTEN